MNDWRLETPAQVQQRVRVRGRRHKIRVSTSALTALEQLRQRLELTHHNDVIMVLLERFHGAPPA